MATQAAVRKKQGTDSVAERGRHSGVHNQEGVEGDSPRSSGPVVSPDYTRYANGFYSSNRDEALRLIAKTGRVSVDLETRGLHPHKRDDAAIGAVIMRTGGKTFITRSLPDWWSEVLEDDSTQVDIFNAQFDLMWMIHDSLLRGKPLTYARNVRDPMLLSQLSNTYRTKTGAAKAGNPGAWEPNDLGYVLRKYGVADISKGIDHDKVDWAGRWTRSMVEYMVEDIEFLPIITDILESVVTEQGQERAARIEQDVVFGTAWMTYNGITPDLELWGCTQAEPYWHTPQDSLHAGDCIGAIAEWREHNTHLYRHHLRKAFPTVLNFNSPKQLMEAMPSVIGGPIPNTRKATLKQLENDFYPLQLLAEYRWGQTRLKNWGPKYLNDYVCRQCSRFHPSWRQIGTETARYSCSAPNLQQIPRAPEFRRMFKAAEGMQLASLDYSAIEVLTAAVFAEDGNLLAACATGDPHAAAARMTSMLTEEEWDQLAKEEMKDRRQSGKIVNFGLLFGGGKDGLITQARDLFNTNITESDAIMMMRNYYRAFPGLLRTKNWAYDLIKSPEKRLEIVNAVGFRRYLEGHNRKPTSCLNTWIQSTAGYGIKSGFKHLREAGLLPFLCMQVHDELIFEFPEEDAEELAANAKACMIAGMREVLGAKMPVKVDCAIGSIWL